jgi:hypothetical protein
MITIRRPVIKHCPFKDETDTGQLVIELPGDAPELHHLASQIDRLCTEPITHEDFTRAVAALFGSDARVITRWHTGPWSVEVQAGDDLPDPTLHTAGA